MRTGMRLLRAAVLAGSAACATAALAGPAAVPAKERVVAVQLDLARQIESVAFVKSYMARVRSAGYNTIVLYLEDRVKTPSYPYASDEESYTLEEMRGVSAYGAEIGLDVVPVVSPLGHTERFLRHPQLAKFAETRAGVGRFGPRKSHNDFCLSDPEARAWMERYISEVAAAFPSRNFHFGFDETFDTGWCERCRPIMEKEGLDRLYLNSVLWAHGVASRLGKRMWIWEDFFDFFSRDAIKAVPRDVVLCCWNYDRAIEKAGPRGHFGGRLRRDVLKEYERLGFDCLVCPWFEYENIRTFTEYAGRRRTLGEFLTQWEMENDFHGAFLPRVLGAGLLWTGRASLAGGEWLDAGIAAAYPTCDAAQRRALSVLIHDQTKLKFHAASLDKALNAPPASDRIPRWESAVDELRRAPSRPGDGAVPADPLSEAALLDDVVVRGEMSVICAKACEAMRYLADPERLADVARAEKGRLAALRARWAQLVARREAQWRAWRRGGISGGAAAFHASLPSLVEAALSRPDEAPESEWILEADIAMVDTHGAPHFTVEGRFADRWKKLADGVWKPAVGAPGYAPKLVPATFAEPPSQLRISCRGYGAGSLCHVSLRNRSRRAVPVAILAVEGAVVEPQNLLVDDYRETRFGDPDCTAAINDPKRADIVASVTLGMAAD
ncbi:MAG: family 20 glycosylhydrolase [Kiritimatiellae bacterium]|nr:family 20 glycosylhydrolase [Kiritimatiellia bacterium]